MADRIRYGEPEFPAHYLCAHGKGVGVQIDHLLRRPFAHQYVVKAVGQRRRLECFKVRCVHFSGKGFVRTVAQWLACALLAAAKIDGFIFGGVEFGGCEGRAFVRAVAKGLRLAQTTSAPVVVSTGLDWCGVRGFLGNVSVHGVPFVGLTRWGDHRYRVD